MDSAKLIARAKNILTTPKTEWPVAAAEPATVNNLYLGYIAIIAALPVIAQFIKGSLIGTSFLGVTVRAGIGAGIGRMILGYILSLVLVYVMALIINALAGTFGAKPNLIQALKTVAYAWTAWWIAGIGVIVPWLGLLIMLAGGVYSIYLLYLGLPHTMQCPAEKAGRCLRSPAKSMRGWPVGRTRRMPRAQRTSLNRQRATALRSQLSH